ncbi:hypothetical protein ACFLUV_02595 [Elusimicrobiota bacterium]
MRDKILFNFDIEKINAVFMEKTGKGLDFNKKTTIGRVGIGVSKGHFGEYLQGHFDDIHGGINDRACITVPLKVNMGNCGGGKTGAEDYYELPVAEAGSIAVFEPGEDGKVVVEPADKIFSKNTAEFILKLTGKAECSGRLRIVTGGEVSRGLGTSTGDIIATLRAVSDSFSINFKDRLVGQFVTQIEGASDGLMYDDATLFITTQGKVLEAYDVEYPAVEILGFDTSIGKAGVDTLDIPPRHYSDEEKEQLVILRSAVKTALEEKNIELLGQVSTSSAQINQRFLKKPHLEEIIELSKKNSAAGIVAAHSGTMVGVIMDVRKMPTEKELKDIIKGLRGLGFSDIKRYLT